MKYYKIENFYKSIDKNEFNKSNKKIGYIGKI
jgi:hypothetical protein